VWRNLHKTKQFYCCHTVQQTSHQLRYRFSISGACTPGSTHRVVLLYDKLLETYRILHYGILKILIALLKLF